MTVALQLSERNESAITLFLKRAANADVVCVLQIIRFERLGGISHSVLWGVPKGVLSGFPFFKDISLSVFYIKVLFNGLTATYNPKQTTLAMFQRSLLQLPGGRFGEPRSICIKLPSVHLCAQCPVAGQESLTLTTFCT